MFGNKNLQDRIKELEQQNASLTNMIENLGKSSDHDFVIKLIPETSDQFYVDGEFTVDSAQAIYKAAQLNFSEAVCWKAGKEVAKRGYEAKIQKALDYASSQKDELSKALSDNKDLQEELDKLRRSFVDDSAIMSGLRDQVKIASQSVTMLNEEIDRLKKELAEKTALMDNYQRGYEASRAEVEKLLKLDTSEAITTSIGILLPVEED